jgi:hypothetical protein
MDTQGVCLVQSTIFVFPIGGAGIKVEEGNVLIGTGMADIREHFRLNVVFVVILWVFAK